MTDVLDRIAEAGFELDDEGMPDGWQMGRAARIADWKFRKEQEEFEELCRVLQHRKSSLAYLEKLRSTSEGREHLRRIHRRYRQRHHARLRQMERQRRLAAYQADPPVCTCRECQVTWCPLYGTPRSSFCSKRCRNRWHGKRRQRSRGLRNMSIRDQVHAVLAEDNWLSVPELVARTGANPRSLAVCLGRWAKAGELRRRGRKREHEYALIEGAHHER